MTSQQAQRYVLISVFGLLVISAYRGKLATQDVSFQKRLWGVGVLAVMLGLLADVAPQIAGPFAILALLGDVTHGGDKALHNFLGKIGGGGGTSLTAPPGPQGPVTNPHPAGTPPGTGTTSGPVGPVANH